MGGLRLGFLVLSSLLVCSAQAEPFELDLIETQDIRLLYFDPFQTYLTPHVTKSFHNSIAFQKQVLGWTPYDKTTVLLNDFADYGNGAALISPTNLIMIDIAPKNRTLESAPSTERFFQLMNHELTHISTMDGWNSQDARWRRFFAGKPRQTNQHPESILYNYLTTPRLSSPRWYAEGSATFLETWMSGGVGRAQGAYDEMVFRAIVRDGAHFYSNLGLVSEGTEVDFQVGVNAYLYGTRFMSYLSYQYSPDHLLRWLIRSEDSKRYYEKQFAHVFGKPLETVWDEWIAFEREFQARNLEEIRKVPLTRTEPLVDRALGSVSRSFYDPDLDAMIAAFRYPGVVAHTGVLSLKDGSIRRLVDVKGPLLYRVTSPAYDPASKTLFYTTDNAAYRDLRAVNVETGAAKMLIEDARVGDLVFNESDQSIWALRHLNGLASLVRIPAPYTEWNMVYTWPHGKIPFEMDISPDGTLLSMSVAEIDGSQYLRLFRIEDLRNGKADHISQFDFTPAIPEGFVFTPDGRYLYGSSYYTGVSNIIRYEVANGAVEWVSNADTGLFRPIPLEDGRLIAFEFTGDGFLPAMIDPQPLDEVSRITFLGNEIANKHPAVRDWDVVSQLGEQPFEEIIIKRGKYRPSRELQLIAAYPMIEGYRDSESIGYHFQFSDPMQLNNLDFSLGYSWDDDLRSSEKLHAQVTYKALNWNVTYWHNDADFYDLFGPKKRSRKGDALLFDYKKSLIFDDPRKLSLTLDLDYYTGLDELPDFQDISTFSFQDILQADVSLHYTNTRKSLGAVDHEKGWRWDASLFADHASGETIPKARAGVDFGFALPWKHSSIWLYNSVGAADGDRLNPLANFFFGGFQNNYVDDGEVKRYREHYTFPGFDISEIGGKSYMRSLVEWNLPPVRFRAVGKPSFYLSHLRPAIFFGALQTDSGKSFERSVTTAGIQLDLKFTLAHRLPMTLSFGYAAGFEDGDEHDNEWLLSLKIL